MFPVNNDLEDVSQSTTNRRNSGDVTKHRYTTVRCGRAFVDCQRLPEKGEGRAGDVDGFYTLLKGKERGLKGVLD